MTPDLVEVGHGLVSGLSPLETTVVVVVLSIVAAVALEFVVIRGMMRFSRRTETRFDNIVVQELRLPLVLTAGLIGVYLLTQDPSIREGVVLTSDQLDTFFGKPALSVVTLSWAVAANRTVNRVVDRVKSEAPSYDFAPVLSNVWSLVVLVGTIGILLSIWEYSIAPLLGAAGVAGIAVGFAAKDTVANFFGGISLYFDDTYVLGDYIELESGEAGTVVEVGIRSTTLLTRDEVVVVVPNSALNESKLINHSDPKRRRRLRVPITVAYGTDLDEFEELVLAVADEEDTVLDSPTPRMRFRRFGDHGLEYELLCWVGTPSRMNKARHHVNREIYDRLAEAGMEIPYPQQEVRIREPSSDGATGVAGAGELADGSGDGSRAE